MKVEIRQSGDLKCEACGATELVYSGTKPLAVELVAVFEREMVRREIALARVMRDHLAVVAAEYAVRETEMANQMRHEAWLAEREHEALLDEIVATVVASPLDVPNWRKLRRRRSGIFADRILAEILALVEATKYENAGPKEELELA